MNITFKILLNKRQENKKKLYPIILRIYKDGTYKEHSLNIKIPVILVFNGFFYHYEFCTVDINGISFAICAYTKAQHNKRYEGSCFQRDIRIYYKGLTYLIRFSSFLSSLITTLPLLMSMRFSLLKSLRVRINDSVAVPAMVARSSRLMSMT
jgi:hypothetical protein